MTYTKAAKQVAKAREAVEELKASESVAFFSPDGIGLLRELMAFQKLAEGLTQNFRGEDEKGGTQ